MNDDCYCCKDCIHILYDDYLQENICKRSYMEVDSDDFACKDFELWRIEDDN